MRFNKLLSVALLAATLAATGACTRIQNNEGFIADEQLLASVQPGVDNRNSVQRTLGRPTLASQWDDRTWYYVSRNSRQLAFLRPRPSSQNILAVTFDDKGVVQKVERRGLEQVVNLDPNSDKTPTRGREKGFFEEVFGNIGAVGAGAPGGAGGPQ